ncbi:small GTP-binding protein domain protein [Aphanothece sacrum FPU1]|uniref:Small GTP-binding protein domain protein n=1 Tax=Aphanothece sacrum FPU1 TaxID=1920663 RepID=A0A401IJD1_APHSA|nr:small GTP-binding protein domain protein [Aphanothece sacrum FPU1]GBF85401.1 small GTP-binding protein [Aphanothece sacrum FPU3]
MTQTQQETHLQQARVSLQQALSWYASFRRHWNYPPNPELQAAVRQDLQALKEALDKVEQNIIKIATFGLVSRGKSAVVNALIGQKLLDTGPLHGVTQWPKSVRWTPPSGKIQIEFIDTPGLDEIQGEARANMAQEIARQADLILFIVAGDITRTEYQALWELRRAQKPLILVFNKIDLYPEKDCETIYKQLQNIAIKSQGKANPLLSTEEIIMVAAEPQPIPIRVEYPNGKVTEEWETPPPDIEQLRQTILNILNQEGKSLLSINALMQAKQAEENIAQKTLEIRQKEAEKIIWQYTKYKALIVGLNPVALFDIIGGAFADLSLIRALAQLYGLPITNHEAGKLWRKILFSSGGLLLTELGSSLILGVGKSASAVSSFLESPAILTTYGTTALMQGGMAGYCAYIIGKAAQEYLEKGCSWGPLGPSTVIKTILDEIDRNTILYRLRQEF